ncbi:MAG: ABC transporter ATP-binding protein [Gammaproteobacteria bacterium]
MSAQTRKQQSDSELITAYTDQPSTLPVQLRAAIEARLNEDPVQLYAMADLDAAMKLSQIWVALGPRHVVTAQAVSDAGTPVITSIDRDRIKAITERPGLSCTVLTLLGDAGEPALAVLRYTHRQRRAMENIKFIIEQQLAGYDVDPHEADAAYAASVAQAIKDAQAAVAGHHLAVLWRLLAYLRPYRLQLGLGMMAAAVMTALSLAPPFLTRYLIDDVVQPFAGGVLAMEEAMTLGWIVIGGLALTYLARDACHWLRLRLMSTVGEFIARDLRRELYEHLQTLSLSFYSRKQTGSIISRVSHDTDRLWDFVAFGIVEVSLSILMLVGLSAVLLALDWRLGLVMVLPVPLLIFSFMVHSRTLKRLFLRAWRKWSGLTEVISDTVPGMRVVKAFNQEQREVNRFNERNDNALVEFNSLHTVWTRFWPAVILGLHAMAIGVWAFALPRLLGGPEAAGTQLSFGTFVAFLLYMGMFMNPIEAIGMMTRMMNRATSSAMRIFEVLDTEPEIRDVVRPVKLEPVSGGVTFENVTFAYDGIRQVLKGVSFDVAPGEMIGLVGKSGSGKTTVTNLIARFYEPSSGRISVDGIDIRRLDTGHYRRQLGMVLQDPHLFHGSVLSNIRYAAPEADLEEIIEAARAANAHDFICQLPHGYDTVVGERGHTLSGGERQRVSIARAVLNNPRILILDEATSSVDTETERKIQEALERLIQGRTVFAVAHRLSTLRRASRLLVLDDGRIEEVGTHAELLRKDGGVYRRLHELQRELHEMYAV